MFRFGLLSVASVVLASAAFGNAASADPINFCTGGKTGNYYAVGGMVAEQADAGAINIINTAGSWENLQKLKDGSCDVALVQSDAPNAFKTQNPEPLPIQRMTSLYMEYANLICNVKANISSIDDLNEKTKIIVGKNGSGTYVTWSNFVSQNKDLGKVPTVPGSNDDGNFLTLADGHDAQCLLFIGGAKLPKLVKLAAASEGALGMADAYDSSFLDIKDEDGNSVYTYAKIPNYDGFAGHSWFDVKTVSVRAVLYVRKDFVASRPDDFTALNTAVAKALPSIHAQFGGIE